MKRQTAYRTIVYICVACVIYVCDIYGQNNQKQVDWLSLGNQQYDSSNFDAAAKYYRKSIDEGQNLSFAWFNLGNCNAQKKDYVQALVAYRRSTELSPNWSRPWMLLGDIYFLFEDYDEAIVAYTRFLDLEPDDSYAWRWKGESALKMGGQLDAQQYLEASLKNDPDQIDAYFALAESHASMKDYDAAIKAMEDAILLSPKAGAEVYFYLGYLYEQAELPKKAIRAYEEGLLLSPQKTSVALRICDIYKELKEDFLAIISLESAIKGGNQSADLYIELGNLYFAQERYPKAREAYQKALERGSVSAQTGLDNVKIKEDSGFSGLVKN